MLLELPHLNINTKASVFMQYILKGGSQGRPWAQIIVKFLGYREKKFCDFFFTQKLLSKLTYLFMRHALY